jgi:hypothetical protein
MDRCASRLAVHAISHSRQSTEIFMSKQLVRFVLLSRGLAITGYANPASAADCVIHSKRIACDGQEAEAYKKCAGKQECDEEITSATTEEACMKAALASCDILRPKITNYKVVISSFKGKALNGGFTLEGKPDAHGPNFCGADRPDFNKCK